MKLAVTIVCVATPTSETVEISAWKDVPETFVEPPQLIVMVEPPTTEMFPFTGIAAGVMVVSVTS